MEAIATSTLMMLAGRCRPCGSLAAMTAPLSRSATSQASAETSFGSAGVFGAVTMPQLPSASPPTGLAGTASGIGGSPAVGASDESTAFGVFTLYGQSAGAALGSAPGSAFASGIPTGNVAGAASVTGAAIRKSAAARHDAERNRVIVCAQ